jgi:hypothetical protein
MQSPINWFDLLVVVVVLLGVRKGRRSGMSVELMPMLQWIAIIIAGAFLYRPLGDMLADSAPMGHLACYITVYVFIAIATKLAFTLIGKSAGGKLVGSDAFGRAEFYLAMGAAGIRFLCILLAGLALLNAPFYSKQDIAKEKAYQEDMYGSTFFPGLAGVQEQVFKNSFLGSFLKTQAEFLLITPTKSENKGLQRRKDDLP